MRPPRRGADTRSRGQVFRSFLAGSVPWLLLAGLLAFMWPVRFGGSTNFIIVSGRSMESTYHTGDLVITKKQPTYRVGDVVVYRIPGEGAGGGREIVHRLHERLPDGRFLVRGDNNKTNDPWIISTDEIVGSKWLMIAKGGIFLGFLRSILMLAVLFGVLVTWVFWPRDDATDDAAEQPAAANAAAGVGVAAPEPHWLDDDAIIGEWDTLISSGIGVPAELPAEVPSEMRSELPSEVPSQVRSERPAGAAVMPRALHWLDDDGVPDVWLAEVAETPAAVSVR